MILHQLWVNLKNNSYPIYIGEDLLHDKAIFAEHLQNKRLMVVTNNTVADLYLSKLKQSLADFQVDSIILPDGEQYKTLATWESILDELIKCKHHRDSTLLTLGGGVIGDMGGFAAATYMRGIDFIQIPTTLLSQVDASIGGKTAVNHPGGKNFIGAFAQPKAVIIDINTLDTLPEREFNAGLAEIVKAALIKDLEFFNWLEKNVAAIMLRNKKILSEAILRACKIKCDIVAVDEKENNIRALLNLGHTFAHAIERALGYGTWLHGEAVAAGLVLAAKLSHVKGLTTAAECEQIENLLLKMNLPTKMPKDITFVQLMEGMRMDKKVKQDQLRFILLNSIGQAIISDNISEQDLHKL